jgi:hypothetical protein
MPKSKHSNYLLALSSLPNGLKCGTRKGCSEQYRLPLLDGIQGPGGCEYPGFFLTKVMRRASQNPIAAAYTCKRLLGRASPENCGKREIAAQ